MKKFRATFAPIYIASLTYGDKSFESTYHAFKAFVEKFPQYENCCHDDEYDVKKQEWTLNIYREAALDIYED
jgi:hypothetical protein